MGRRTGWSQISSGWSCASLTARPCILVARPGNLAYPFQFRPDLNNKTTFYFIGFQRRDISSPVRGLEENMSLYKDQYRIESARLVDWDYSFTGYYFVTICTYNHIDYFGDIKNSKMNLSEIGRIANNYWNEIPTHFPYTKLDKFIIMPNHLHGIIKIHNGNDPRRDAIYRVSHITQPEFHIHNVRAPGRSPQQYPKQPAPQ
jgi:REP element-mobilizing transposase RayT